MGDEGAHRFTGLDCRSSRRVRDPQARTQCREFRVPRSDADVGDVRVFGVVLRFSPDPRRGAPRGVCAQARDRAAAGVVSGGRLRLLHQLAVVPAVSCSGTMGVSRVERDAAVRSLVLESDRRHPADQRTQQLLSEHACLADRRRHRRLLVVQRPSSPHGDRTGIDGDPLHVRPRDPLACRHRRRHRRRHPQRGNRAAHDRHVGAGGAGARVGVSHGGQEGSSCRSARQNRRHEPRARHRRLSESARTAA